MKVSGSLRYLFLFVAMILIMMPVAAVAGRDMIGLYADAAVQKKSDLFLCDNNGIPSLEMTKLLSNVISTGLELVCSNPCCG